MFDILLVGAGDRGMIYARQSLESDRFRITAVVEPQEDRRRAAALLFGIPEGRQFASVQEAAALPKLADAVFNCTMDSLHADTAIPLLERGYDMLLEKPIASNRPDMLRILEAAERSHSRVLVCHVLRYAPFYRKIKELLPEIGQILNIQMAEQVSYYHAATSYFRGKYGDPEICGSGMLLSKCSHDLDIMAWLMDGEQPIQVSSAGALTQFRPENAPAGSAKRCLPDCVYRDRCRYSAAKLYVEHPQRWANRVWNDCALQGAAEEEKLRALAEPDNPYGACVYHTGKKIVDHQSVLVQFESGAVGTLSMTGGASAAGRSIRIIGTLGEIEGQFERECFTLYTISPESPGGRTARVIDVSKAQSGDAHGGGDRLLLEDFWALLENRAPSICCTSLHNSVTGHEIVFRAEAYRLHGRTE